VPERIVILGSTGSVGCSTLDVLRGLRDRFEVVGLAAGSRWRELAAQAVEWTPEYVAISDERHHNDLHNAVGEQSKVLSGANGLVDLIERADCHCVVSAIVGVAGLAATVKAVRSGARVAIANKETLVVAGPLITRLAKQTGATLLPVDSEHSAVFQALASGRADEVKRIYLTASGGPLRTWSRERIEQATLEEALSHPVWDMGPKISIDSATMMNKALEVIEARWLFDVEPDQISVLVHPEAMVHGMVEFQDGAVVAHMARPDMRHPIQYALTWPQRLPMPELEWRPDMFGQLTFEPPDPDRFPAITLGFKVARDAGTAGAALNAANEAAVEAFRLGHIKLGEITRLSADTLSRHSWSADPDWDTLMEVDQWARNEVRRCMTC
jgi:1-deoxy-D-xylulose-5-phosphate reductoisomerase